MRLTAALVAALIVPVFTYAGDPPKGLKWGMPYDEVKQVLEAPSQGEPVKVNKLSKDNKTRVFFPKHQLPDGYRFTEIEKVELLDKKVSVALAVFDQTGGLVLIQYQFRMVTKDVAGDIQQTWAFYQKLSDALKSKYGEPTRNQVTPVDFGVGIPADTYLETVWEEEGAGDQMRALVTNFKIGGGLLHSTNYYVMLEYSSKAWWDKNKEENLKEDL
jgi:hypothetical protein